MEFEFRAAVIFIFILMDWLCFSIDPAYRL